MSQGDNCDVESLARAGQRRFRAGLDLRQRHEAQGRAGFGEHGAGGILQRAFGEAGGFAGALDPGFSDDEARPRRREEADLHLQRHRRGVAAEPPDHRMRHRRVDPAGDEPALHHPARMAHVQPRLILDHRAPALHGHDAALAEGLVDVGGIGRSGHGEGLGMGALSALYKGGAP